jgi:hypothetical protein
MVLGHQAEILRKIREIPRRRRTTRIDLHSNVAIKPI